MLNEGDDKANCEKLAGILAKKHIAVADKRC